MLQQSKNKLTDLYDQQQQQRLTVYGCRNLSHRIHSKVFAEYNCEENMWLKAGHGQRHFTDVGPGEDSERVRSGYLTTFLGSERILNFFENRTEPDLNISGKKTFGE